MVSTPTTASRMVPEDERTVPSWPVESAQESAASLQLHARTPPRSYVQQKGMSASGTFRHFAATRGHVGDWGYRDNSEGVEAERLPVGLDSGRARSATFIAYSVTFPAMLGAAGQSIYSFFGTITFTIKSKSRWLRAGGSDQLNLLRTSSMPRANKSSAT
jgi:hypothetical protein